MHCERDQRCQRRICDGRAAGAYASSKWALRSVSEITVWSLASRSAGFNIRVLSLSTGVIATTRPIFGTANLEQRAKRDIIPQHDTHRSIFAAALSDKNPTIAYVCGAKRILEMWMRELAFRISAWWCSRMHKARRNILSLCELELIDRDRRAVVRFAGSDMTLIWARRNLRRNFGFQNPFATNLSVLNVFTTRY